MVTNYDFYFIYIYIYTYILIGKNKSPENRENGFPKGKVFLWEFTF